MVDIALSPIIEVVGVGVYTPTSTCKLLGNMVGCRTGYTVSGHSEIESRLGWKVLTNDSVCTPTSLKVGTVVLIVKIL